MINLDTTDVLLLHKMIFKKTEGTPGVRDIGVLESSIYHAYATFEEKDLYPSIEEKAARQAYGIIRNHPFIDGNKRTGLLLMLVFLELNNIRLKFSQSELVKLGTEIADGKLKSSDITKWIIRHSRTTS